MAIPPSPSVDLRKDMTERWETRLLASNGVCVLRGEECAAGVRACCVGAALSDKPTGSWTEKGR